MTIRNLTGDGDWTFGQGRQNYLTGQDAIALNIATRLRSFLNDTFWAMDFGIDWWNLLGQRNPAAQANVILQVRECLARSYGVARVISVTASLPPGGRRLSVTASVDTIFSQGATVTVEP